MNLFTTYLDTNNFKVASDIAFRKTDLMYYVCKKIPKSALNSDVRSIVTSRSRSLSRSFRFTKTEAQHQIKIYA